MPNRLALEKSPYLLQHANNPVDWLPWGEEAFEKAKREDKPVFLSVGYSTCHWCHVMERESFENESIARVLNEHFVSIKVDREERPDVDRIYMLFVQASTGSGGWPMSVFLTPDRKPFFGGTYFPPDNRWGRPGFRSVLESLARAWKEDRARVEQSGAQVLEQLRGYSEVAAEGGMPGREVVDSAYRAFRRSFDSKLGGFGGAPKFPRPSVFNFLLRYAVDQEEPDAHNEDALNMVVTTLREMAKGGMRDQLGGGFHRYSVDAHWFVPHFEKMLYDQAQLAVSYIEAYQITRDETLAEVARDIFDYVLRDLSHPEGAFYSAEDADSVIDPAHPHEKGEGAFYIWSAAELQQVLGPRDSTIFGARFGVRENGNVDEDPHGEFTGRNILYQAATEEEVAQRFEWQPEAVHQTLKSAREVLMKKRSTRVRPHLDDKVLTSWNALMISAFAKGAQAFDSSEYAQIARRATDFLRHHLWRPSERTLLRRFREGESAVEGFLDDYAALTLALLDLYEATFQSEDLAWAKQLAEIAIERFSDQNNGGFFSTAEGQADLVLRLKDDYDGAEPSGNSLLTLALLRLARMTGEDRFRMAAERALHTFGSRLRTQGTGVPQMLVAFAFANARPMEIVFAGPPSKEMTHLVRGRFLPNAIVMRAEDAPQPMAALRGLATAYVCENYACNQPVTEAKDLENLLTKTN
jgi:uncharacterized protein YyaL (SSP411 family)